MKETFSIMEVVVTVLVLIILLICLSFGILSSYILNASYDKKADIDIISFAGMQKINYRISCEKNEEEYKHIHFPVTFIKNNRLVSMSKYDYQVKDNNGKTIYKDHGVVFLTYGFKSGKLFVSDAYRPIEYVYDD